MTHGTSGRFAATVFAGSGPRRSVWKSVKRESVMKSVERKGLDLWNKLATLGSRQGVVENLNFE